MESDLRGKPFVILRLSDKNRFLNLMRKIQDIRVASIDPLIPPSKLKDQLPVDEAIVATVVEARETIRRIIKGADRRMLCIVGPCSIHDPQSALDFADAGEPEPPRGSVEFFNTASRDGEKELVIVAAVQGKVECCRRC